MCWNQYIFQGICWNQTSQADQALPTPSHCETFSYYGNDERETRFLNLYEKISFPFLSSISAEDANLRSERLEVS